MKYLKKYIGLLFIIPNLALATQHTSNLEVSLKVFPSCHIQTKNNNNKDINIVSHCSHEDFYITVSKIDNTNQNNKSVLMQEQIIIKKNKINNETHTTVSNLKRENMLLTVNF